MSAGAREIRGAFLAPNKDGTPWWVRVFRITNIRVVAQVFFFALFSFLLWATWFSRMEGYPVSLFLEVDPLVGVATALSTGTVYRWLWRGLFVLIPTLLLGRVFCNWMCPYGSLHQFVGWLFNVRRNRDEIAAHRYHWGQQLKYLVLVWMLVMAAMGSLQIGLLDPICLLVRSFTVFVAPASDLAVTNLAEVLRVRLGMDPEPLLLLHTSPGTNAQRLFSGSWAVGAMLVGLVGMNVLIPRFFCRFLCPLGAFLGWLSRFSLWRIDRDLTKCTDCDLCLRRCEGAADPQAALRKSECFVCFNCIDDCPEDALTFALAPVPVKERIVGGIAAIKQGTATLFGEKLKSKVPDQVIPGLDVPRRRLVFAGLTGVAAFPFIRLTTASGDKSYANVLIRPPGSVEEKEFLERCIRCDQCLNVCPTNVLQPATFAEAGVEGLWTPVMDFETGFCQLGCTLCSEVCPTGAIQKISVEQKLGVEEYAEAGPISLGTAFFDRGRCLPWAMETPCVVCEEVCPTTPKAIGAYHEEIERWDGKKVLLNKPYMRPELCIGCGICEHECPVVGLRAVRVSAIGETRSKKRSLLLSTSRSNLEKP